MSGQDRTSGGSIFDGGGDDCFAIHRRTLLNSPTPAVIRRLKPADVLTLALSGAQRQRRIEALTAAGERAGVITFDGIAKLKRCLENGVEFIAQVTEVSSPNTCHVIVRAAPDQ